MSKLLGLFGRSKKKEREDENIVVYQLKEHPNFPTGQPADDNKSQSSGNYQLIRSHPARKSLRLSKTQSRESIPAEQTGRRISSGRQSVLVPVSQIGQTFEQRRGSRMLEVSEVQPRKLPGLQEGSDTRFSLSDPRNFKPTRPSAIQHDVGPGPNKQVRLSIVTPVGINEHTRTGRLSMAKPSDGAERFSQTPTHQPVAYVVRRSSIKPTNRQSLAFESNSTREAEQRDDTYVPGRQTEQLVFAAQCPTRGRTKSVLQQSVKTLTSKKDESPVAWKNIRHSTVTDVFSADVKQKHENPGSTGFVTMERGQGMLVSELLNPITSIFVSDLKNPVPKDPLRRPHEANNWVRPRQNSVRQVVTPNYQRPTPQANVPVGRAATPSSKMQPRGNQRQQHSRYEDDESSSYSDESEESYVPRVKYQKRPVQQRVYAAEMPDMILPDVAHAVEDNTELVADTAPSSPSPSKHSQISSDVEGRGRRISQPPYVGRLSLAQKTEVVDTLDFLCNPPDDISKDAVLAIGSGSKLRLQMELKKEESKADSHNKTTL